VTGSSRERFAQVVRAPAVDLALACLLLAAEEDEGLDADLWLRALDDLAAEVPAAGSGLSPADRLRAALAEFHGVPADYGDLRSSLLPDVLRRRRGLPILLSVVWVEVARRAGVAAYGVGLPGHVVVGLPDDDGDPADPRRPYERAQLVDPWQHGRPLDTGAPQAMAAAAGMPYHPELLRPWEPVEILQRVLANIRAWAGSRPDRHETRLWAVELGLILPRHPVGLRRERGELRVLGGDFLGGAADLEEYAAAVEPIDEQAAGRARAGARAARARLN
jgi:regulator of sirC expression with transglutaminase-like and TPR domain